MIFLKGKRGADVSFYQDDDNTPQKIDFVKMKAAGIEWVVLRAGQNTWIDEDFKDYMSAIKGVFDAWMIYWFFDSRSSPASQVNILQAVLAGNIPPVIAIDLEESYGGAYKGEKYWKEMLELCKSRFPTATIIIYSANWWWQSQTVSDSAYFAKYPLWVAGYPGGTNPDPANVTLPLPWRSTQAVAWQYTDKGDGKLYGVESLGIDLNYFNDNFNYKEFFKLDDEEGGGTVSTITHSIEIYNAGNKLDGNAILPNTRIDILNDGGYETSNIPVTNPPPPTYYTVRGDEELAEYGYKSRTGASNWTGVGAWTPSVFRFEVKKVEPTSDYRVNISPLDSAIRALNEQNVKKINYLYSSTTGMFNKTGYPKQQYLVMSGNKLEPIAIEGNYLKFKTLTPTSVVSGMTSVSHPQFIHTWDLVGWIKNKETGKWETKHKPNTPQGVIKNFLVTKEGFGYIPLRWVKLV